MFKESSNQALIQKVSLYCKSNVKTVGFWISAVVLTKNYAVTTLYCIPETFREVGLSVILYDTDGQQHNALIHGLKISDYVVFKKTDGVFDNYPEIMYPMLLGKYITVGFAFGEKIPSLRVGHISSLSTGSRGFFYGDSCGLPGFSGGGVFCTKKWRTHGNRSRK